MQFKDIIGQADLKQHLLHAVQEGRVSHAQLFSGATGTGNLPLAIAYAQYVSCENRGETDSCGECPSCHKYQKLIHPDLHFVFPVNTTKSVSSEKKPVSDHFIADWRGMVLQQPYFTEQQWYEHIEIENKQGIISAAEADSILSKLSLKAYESAFKIMIIWLPEKMNAVAANRLLKLIEEPPTNTLFLLVSDNPLQIISTIRSRTQLVKLPPIAEGAITDALRAQHEVDETQAYHIARLSGGSYTEALRLLSEKDEKSDYFHLFVSLMRLSYSNNVLELLNWADEISSIGRERQKNFLLYAQRLLRENFILQQQVPDVVYLSGEELDFSKKLSPFINPDNVFTLYDQINLALGHITQNGNPKLIFTDMVLKMVKLIG